MECALSNICSQLLNFTTEEQIKSFWYHGWKWEKKNLLHLIPCLTFPLPSLLHVFCSSFFTLARLSVRLSIISYAPSPILKETFLSDGINHENKMYTIVTMYIYYDTPWASPRIWSGQLNVQSSSRLGIKSDSLDRNNCRNRNQQTSWK